MGAGDAAEPYVQTGQAQLDRDHDGLRIAHISHDLTALPARPPDGQNLLLPTRGGCGRLDRTRTSRCPTRSTQASCVSKPSNRPTRSTLRSGRVARSLFVSNQRGGNVLCPLPSVICHLPSVLCHLSFA